jgi:hypothetical protein
LWVWSRHEYLNWYAVLYLTRNSSFLLFYFLILCERDHKRDSIVVLDVLNHTPLLSHPSPACTRLNIEAPSALRSPNQGFSFLVGSQGGHHHLFFSTKWTLFNQPIERSLVLDAWSPSRSDSTK